MYIYVICVIKDKIKKTPTEIQKGMHLCQIFQTYTVSLTINYTKRIKVKFRLFTDTIYIYYRF